MAYTSKRFLVVLSIVTILVIAPVFSFAGSDKIYVDIKASGKEDGSKKNPFKSISKALKEADKDDEVHIAAGTYKENISIPKGVDVFGTDADKVIIQAKDGSKPAVKMKHKTEINKVTIRKGRYGVKVSDKSRASIVECIIEDNYRDGIKVEESDLKDKYMVSVVENVIRDNNRAGLFAEKSRISVIDNLFVDNDSDGADLSAGTKAWIYGNKFKDNDGSGLKMIMSGSEIWTKNNTYKDNDREGIEVNAYGSYGRIDINKSKFYDNDRYGVARVQRVSGSSNAWNGLTFRGETIFAGNGSGDISPIVLK